MKINENLTVYRKMYLLHNSLFDTFDRALNICDGKGTINPVYVRIDNAKQLLAKSLDATQCYIETSMDDIDYEMTEAQNDGKLFSWAYTINSGPEKKGRKEIIRLSSFICRRMPLPKTDIIAIENGYDTLEYNLSSDQIIFTKSKQFPDYNLVIEFIKDGTTGAAGIIKTIDVYLIKKN
ncbi:hypothetical protein N1I81_22840 [Bacillus sp. FSL M8-0052]|uniref:Uncharacterized protein n=1 Tax=Bacillus glycinifermentans TaxID=1664069 RepID=A0AAJ3Z312_9BACI|nr:hypothetical protein [Bacillus glycinifermentans]QAT68029.1 hypothetical protein EQZ20_24460 [Bacillus glycinifermentans]